MTAGSSKAFLGMKSLQVSELTNERSQLTEQLDQASRNFEVGGSL